MNPNAALPALPLAVHHASATTPFPATLKPRASTPSSPALIGLDWGTTRLRAFLLAADGQVLAEADSPHGLRHLPAPGGPTGFETALAQVAGDWRMRWPSLPLLAGGMVGSQQGWREAPYLDCPARPADLLAHAVAVPLADGGRLHIVPGLRHRPDAGPPDMMRGEEVQIAGVLASHPAPELVVLLPGTHAKWARVQQGQILDLCTHMTGELFALLSQHSLLAEMLPAAEAAAETLATDSGFQRGLALAAQAGPGDLGRQLFAVRTLGLDRQLTPAALPGLLSGLLIGHELRAGLAWLQQRGAAHWPLVLAGEPALCQRYAWALRQAGQPVAAELGNTAPQGLARIAADSGWLATVADC